MSDYAIIHEGRAFTPNRTALDAAHAAEHNAAVQRAELAYWAERPAGMLAYYDDKAGTVQTWLGTTIGTITASKIYRHNLGGRFISLRVLGTNGAAYYGRASYDWGNAIRLRKAAR